MATKNFLDLPGLTTYDGYLKQYIAEHAVEGGQADWSQTDTTAPDYIKNKPTLGTAASKNVPTSGNASSTQVVMGSDTRLTNSRPASDVYSWAKSNTKPSYSASEISYSNTTSGLTATDTQAAIDELADNKQDSSTAITTSNIGSQNVNKAHFLDVYNTSGGIYSDRKVRCKYGAGVQELWFYLYLDGATDRYTAVNAADYATAATDANNTQWIKSFQSDGSTSNGNKYICRLVKDGTNKRYIFQIINNDSTDTNTYETFCNRCNTATYASNASSNFTAVGTITGATIKSTGSVYNNSSQRCVDSYADTSFELINHFLKIKTATNCVISATSGNYSWAIASWSDKRLKDNISNSTVNGMDIINKIKLHSFDFKDEKYGEHQDIGYIAQELKEVVPEAVISVPISEEEKDNYNADELYQVEDKYLIKYLVKAVQELSAEVESLRNKG